MTPSKITPDQLVQVYASSDRLLLEATKDYENLSTELCNFRDAHTETMLAYERAYSDAIERLKVKDEKVTIVKELAQRETFDLYAQMCRAECMMKRCETLRDAELERINTLKKILDTRRT